jgi:hypothetical protein
MWMTAATATAIMTMTMITIMGTILKCQGSLGYEKAVKSR